jgi:hypothetical protein
MPTTVGTFTVFGAIEQKWLQFGATAGSLGAPVSNEAATFDGVGRAQSFQKGFVSWHPKTGAQVVWGLIAARWLQIGREKFGYPVTDEMTCPDRVGRFNRFRALHVAGTPDCSIYWTPASGAHEIYGAIREKWASTGWERGPLGYPVEPEHDQAGGGRTQGFQRGVITWTARDGAAVHAVSGDSVTFDSGPVTSDLALGGAVHLVVQRNGNFTLSTHAHDSGFDNIDYGMSAVLVTATGNAFTFEHIGHVEGTSAGLPFGTPRRDDDFTVTGRNPAITGAWDSIVSSGRLLPHLSGKDKLAAGLNDLLAQAATALEGVAINAVVALVAA